MKSKSIRAGLAVTGTGLVLLLVFALTGFAAKPAGARGSKDFEVVLSFRDADTDRIASDCRNPLAPCRYDTGANIKVTNDPAALQMVFLSGSERALYFDFTVPVACPGDGCSSPFATGTVETSFSVSECSEAALVNMAVNDPQLCSLAANPGDPQPEVDWRLRFDPTASVDGGEPGEANGTAVNVTCVAASAGQCTQWTIEAAVGERETDPDTDIGSLLSVPAKGRLLKTWEGSYSLPFHITVTRK